MIRISLKSDIIHQINNLNKWYTALEKEQKRLEQSRQDILERHQNNVLYIERKYEYDCIERHKNLKQLRKDLKRSLSQIASEKKKRNRFYEVLIKTSEIIVNQKGGN